MGKCFEKAMIVQLDGTILEKSGFTVSFQIKKFIIQKCKLNVISLQDDDGTKMVGQEFNLCLYYIRLV